MANRVHVVVESVLFALILGVMSFRLAHDRSSPSREAAPVADSTNDLRQRAEKAYQEKNLAVATTLYADILRVEPDDIQARMRLAEVFHQNSWNESALALLNEVFQRDPNNTPAHLLRAKIRRDDGDSDLAMEDYLRVLAIEPNNAEAYYYLGTTYHAAKRVDEAIRAYQQAIASDPTLAKPFFESVPFGIQARVLLGRTYRQQAMDAINVGNRLDGLARLHDALDVLREAVALSKTIRTETDADAEGSTGYEARAELVNTLRQKASVLRRAGNPNGPEVLAVFEEITRVEPEDTEALLEVGTIRYRTAKSRDDLKQAEKPIQRAFELDPLDIDAQVTLKAIRDDLARSDTELAKTFE
jgi:tetratricopeptide (TPR) repeat protein